jgi:chemotaxis protein methyltransferase CheR
MTTNETFFFRDEVQFRVLQNTFLPPLIKARSQSKRLAFWSAASSSGQEALSLAIILCEMGLQDWNIEIHGTDFNQQMVERARQATYIQVELIGAYPRNIS